MAEIEMSKKKNHRAEVERKVLEDRENQDKVKEKHEAK